MHQVMNIIKKFPRILPAFLIIIPRSLNACAVCFSDGGTDMSRGFFWGIVILGSLPFLLMAGLFGLFRTASRKGKPQ